METGHEMCLQDRRGWRAAIKAHKNGSTLRLIGKGLSLITDTLCVCVSVCAHVALECLAWVRG